MGEFMDVIDHLVYMRKFQGATKSLPAGVDQLPLAERLRLYLEVFESGARTLSSRFTTAALKGVRGVFEPSSMLSARL